MQVLLFGGTAEGRVLAEWLPGHCGVTLCVATDYGAALVPTDPALTLRVGRLDAPEMAALMRTKDFTCAVDATHPYAVAVSENIRAACAQAGLPYYRLLRDESAAEPGWIHVPHAAAAADWAQTTSGGILLTTGSKELEAFARPGLRERCYPRVLPAVASLTHALALGFPQKQMLCLQGPFSKALNLALLEQYGLSILITKATGAAGGFLEKADAVRACGGTLVVIDRPSAERGYSLAEIQAILKGELA